MSNYHYLMKCSCGAVIEQYGTSGPDMVVKVVPNGCNRCLSDAVCHDKDTVARVDFAIMKANPQ